MVTLPRPAAAECRARRRADSFSWGRALTNDQTRALLASAMLLLLLLLLLLCARLGIAQFDASAAWPADGGGGSRGSVVSLDP